MAEIQKRTFVKGLDSDTADEYLEDGKDRFRLNVRVLSSENGNLGAIETMAGNTLVPITLATGINTVIGSVEDSLQRKNYYLVHNSASNHAIYEYNQITNSIQLVLQKAILAFSLDFLVTGINVVRLSADAHLLYWTDNNVQPRKINIEKAIAHTNGDFVNGYVTDVEFEPEIINRIKNPPSCPPTYTWGNFTGGTEDAVVFTAKNLNPAGSTDFRQVAADGTSQLLNWSLDSGGGFNSNTFFNPPEDGDYSFSATINANSLIDFNPSPFTADENKNPKLFLNVFMLLKRAGQPDQRISVPFFKQIPYSTTTYELNVTIDNLLTTDNLAWEVVGFIDAGVDDVAHAKVFPLVWTSTLQGAVAIKEPNYLFKKLYTFQYQFIYDDFEVSARSPISKFSFPVVEVDFSNNELVVAHSNRILLDVQTGSSIVTRIRISAKEASETVFRQIAELDKKFLGIGDNTNHIFEFLNSSVSLTIEPNEAVKLFDKVPLKSQSQEFAGQRIMDGLITEGFDQVEVNMQLTLVNRPLVVGALTDHYPARSYLKAAGEYIFGIVYYNAANQSSVTQVAEGRYDTLNEATQKFGTHLFMPFLTEKSLYDADGTLGASDLFITNPLDVEIELFHKPPAFATHYQILRTRNLSFDLIFQWVADTVTYTPSAAAATFVTISIDNIQDSYNVINPDSKVVYDFADGDRIRFIANPNTATTSALLFDYNESEIRSFDSGTGDLVVTLPASSSDDDLRSLSNGVWFEIYRPILAIESGLTLTDQIPTVETGECYDVVTNANGEKLHLGPLENQATQSFDKVTTNVSLSTVTIQIGTVLPLGFVVGDKVKLVVEGFSAFGTQQQVNDLNGLIMTFVDTTFNVFTQQFSMNFTTTATITNGTFNVFGFASKAAKVITTGGDTFIRRQTMEQSITPDITLEYLVEANNANNMYVSVAPDEGRPNLVDPDAREVIRPSTIIWSEKFIPETFINGLSSVFDVNFEFYNQNYGGIFKLYGEDDGLIMFQERKIGKVLVDRTIYTDLQNNITVGAAANVLSPQVVYYSGEFGIGVHPESFAVYGKAKYGLDVIRGVNWRLSQDGLTPISDQNQMHNFFTDKCQDILTASGKVKIYGVYDVKFNEYIVAFEAYVNGNSTSVAGETLAWNEIENQYSTFYGYVPENMVGAGINILTFNAGRLFTHNTNILQSNFYGVQQFSEFHSTLNANPSNVKVLENISEESNDVWAVFEISTPNNQLSNLIEDDFQTKENLQYAAVLRDENTPNVTLPLIEGDVMRDRTMLLKFKYNRTTANRLIAVNFLYIVSNRHNR